MKKLLSTLAIATLFGMISPTAEARDSLSVSFFYENLSPHGSWLEVGDYGYCWQPNDVRSDWSPYSDGRWVYTDAGWTWDSREPYGWAVYHYGRWANIRSVGWVWVPGTEWGPAWVSWRHSSRYVGWAPLPPEARFSISIGFNSWVDNYYDIGPGHYRFVEGRNFGSRRLNTVFVDRSQNVTIVNQTTNITNTTYVNNVVHNGGPAFDERARESSEPIPRYRLDRRQGFEGTNRRPSDEQLGSRVEGDSFSVAALPLEERSAERPERISRTVADAEVEKGWSDVGSADVVAETRKRMQDQVEVPAELPKTPTFVKNAGGPVSPGVIAEGPSGRNKGNGKARDESADPGTEPSVAERPNRPMTPPAIGPETLIPDQPLRPRRPETEPFPKGKSEMRKPTARQTETGPSLPPEPRTRNGEKVPQPAMPLRDGPGKRSDAIPSEIHNPRATGRKEDQRPAIPRSGPAGGAGTSDSPDPRSTKSEPKRMSPQPNQPRPSLDVPKRPDVPKNSSPQRAEENGNAPTPPPSREQGRARDKTPKGSPSTPPAGRSGKDESEKGKKPK